MDFKKIYFKGESPKFHCDPYGIYIFTGEYADGDGLLALDTNLDDGYMMQSLCNFLNGELNVFQPRIKEVILDNNDAAIVFEGDFEVRARGWGYLTGVKNLSNEEAAQVQNDFINWIVDKIKNSFFEQQEENRDDIVAKLDKIAKPRPMRSILKAQQRKNKSIDGKLRKLEEVLKSKGVKLKKK